MAATSFATFLSYDTLRMYDRIGYFGLIIIMFVLPMIGLPLIDILISPFLGFFQRAAEFLPETLMPDSIAN